MLIPSLFALTLATTAPTPCAEHLAPLTAPLPSRAWDEVDDHLREGRAHLRASRLREARAAFEAASALDSSWRTELWVLRVEAAENPESVLGLLSRKERAGERGPDLDYLTGVAFAAQADAAANGGGSGAGFLYVDAATKLKSALAAEPELYADAWPILAAAARNAGDHETSLEAAERVLADDPRSLVALDLRGRAALALFGTRFSEDPRPDEVQALFETARESFTRITELVGRPTSLDQERTLASAWYQLGTVHAFDSDTSAARNAYGEAVGWDPASVDLGQVFNTLGLETFVGCMDFASERFAERHPSNDARDATVQWWRGWALYTLGDLERFDDAERALETAYSKWSGYTNSWYWLMRVRYDRAAAQADGERDFSGAIEALERYGEIDRAGLVATVQATPVDVERIVYLIGQAAGSDLNAAAFLSGVLTEIEPGNDEYWNNLGLFLRDSAQLEARAIAVAERRGQTVEPGAKEAVMQRYERAWEAYSRALELDPSNPRYHNDAAVMLHYYLEREYDRALRMYDRSIELATAILEGGAATEDEAEQMRTYIGWSNDNKKLLLEKIEAERRADG